MNPTRIPFTIDRDHHAIAALCSPEHAETWVTQNTNPAYTLNGNPLRPGPFCAHCVICAARVPAHPRTCFYHHPDPCPTALPTVLWFIPEAIREAQTRNIIPTPFPPDHLDALLGHVTELIPLNPHGIQRADIQEILETTYGTA